MGENSESRKPDEACILPPFAYLVQDYLSCTLSMSGRSLLNAHKQRQVFLSFDDYHLRYKPLLQKAPPDVVK